MNIVTSILIGSLLTFFPSAFVRLGSPPLEKRSSSFCPTCAARDNNPLHRLDRLATIGRRLVVNPLALLRKSDVSLVGTSRGDLGFGVTDLVLGSSIPLAFGRTYLSSRSEDIGLGRGWSFVFADRVNVKDGVATLTDGQGTRTLTNFELTDASIIEHAATTRTYTKIGDAYYLTQVSGPRGINIAIGRDAAGRVSHISNDTGQTLTFEWTKKHLTTVSDSTGRRVSFNYNGERLTSVTDSSRAAWRYYYANGLLRGASDPIGRVILRVRYDKSGRVTSAGDSAGLTQYEYASGRTKVTDPLGAVTTYEHTDKGAITRITDDESRSLYIEYNAAGKAVQVSSSAGEKASMNYDSQNRLASQSFNGSVSSLNYDRDGRVSSMVEGNERTDLDVSGNITSVQSTDPGKSYTATYDARGALSQLKSENRSVSFEYDAQGNQTAVTNSALGRFNYEWDNAGRVTRELFPSGFSRSTEYDARGAVIKQSDNTGSAMSIERDVSGAPTAYIRADGKQMRAVRDETGRVVRDTDFDGNVRTFAYNARGALTDYTARGSHERFEYDHRGLLSAIIDNRGVARTIERDGQGQIERLSYSSTASLRRWSHALQDPPDDCCEDVVTIDHWEPYPSYTYNLGRFSREPLQSAPTDGSGGTYSAEDCAIALTACFVGILGYPVLVGALIAACPESFGLACFGALLAMVGEPLLAVLSCVRAYHICPLSH